MSALKKLRVQKNLTQAQASELLGVSLRSYKSYENDESKATTMKYRYMLEQLEKYAAIDEEHGILTIDHIYEVCADIFKEYSVKYCILFGSYAKGTATASSDVDLLISTDISGLRFYGIAERLRNALLKRVDLLDISQLNNNPQLLDEILKDGVKVYKQH